jgi:hypothetical protein
MYYAFGINDFLNLVISALIDLPGNQGLINYFFNCIGYKLFCLHFNMY